MTLPPSSRTGLLDALRSVLAVEIRARDNYIDDLELLSHPYFRRQISRIKDDEDKHIALLEQLIAVLEKGR